MVQLTGIVSEEIPIYFRDDCPGIEVLVYISNKHGHVFYIKSSLVYACVQDFAERNIGKGSLRMTELDDVFKYTVLPNTLFL